MRCQRNVRIRSLFLSSSSFSGRNGDAVESPGIGLLELLEHGSRVEEDLVGHQMVVRTKSLI